MAPMIGSVFTNDYNADGKIMVEVTLTKQPIQNLRYAVDECGNGAWSIFTNRGEWRCAAETHVEVTQFRDIRQDERLGEMESKLSALTSDSLADIGDAREHGNEPPQKPVDAPNTTIMDAAIFADGNAPQIASGSDSVQVSTNAPNMYWADDSKPAQPSLLDLPDEPNLSAFE